MLLMLFSTVCAMIGGGKKLFPLELAILPHVAAQRLEHETVDKEIQISVYRHDIVYNVVDRQTNQLHEIYLRATPFCEFSELQSCLFLLFACLTGSFVVCWSFPDQLDFFQQLICVKIVFRAVVWLAAADLYLNCLLDLPQLPHTESQPVLHLPSSVGVKLSLVFSSGKQMKFRF